MTPKPSSNASALQLFQAHFKQILNLDHPLCQLANQMDWRHFEQAFEDCYSPEMGRPGNAIRLMVGLHYLKHTFDESDESIAERWVENPYWQYFCGFEYLQHAFPIHPTSLVKWRQRVGADRLEALLAETVRLAVQTRAVRSQQLRQVTVDTTVQEKAVAFPTDARLYTKMILRLARLAKRASLPLRQSYVRVAPYLLRQQSCYARARQFKRARACTRKLKYRLGRLVRDIRRKASVLEGELQVFIDRAERLLTQQRDSHGKLYSIDAPEVECISKGKAHKRYEFGCKVSVAMSNRSNWVLGVQALHGNPYDGHTLCSAVAQVERITRRSVQRLFVDRGYRGHDYRGNAKVHITGQRSRSPASVCLRRRKRRRSAIEPKIGHLKSDHRMDRNYLKGLEGDRINALLAGIGANMRKLLAAFWRALWLWLKTLYLRTRMIVPNRYYTVLINA